MVLSEGLIGVRNIQKNGCSWLLFCYSASDGIAGVGDIARQLFKIHVVCSEQEFIRIGGDRKPLSVVKSQFLKLDSEHMRFVLHCMKENTSKVLNMRQYLLAVLYNAPLTISNYYSSLVQHDMYEGNI